MIDFVRAAVSTTRGAVEPPPLEVEHLWRWFCELAAARTSNGFGFNPITHAEIAAWAALTGSQPSPWELSVLRRMDSAALAVLHAKKTPGTTRGDDEPDNVAAADDVEGVKAILSIIRSRANAAFGPAANE